MLITPFIAETVRLLQRRKEKLEQELTLADSALAGLAGLNQTHKAHIAAGTEAKIGKAVRAAWKAKRKA